jgi:lariat debranching enzyme
MQAVRNADDLQTMAVPDKYREIMTFYKYYSGEKVAPYPTIFSEWVSPLAMLDTV